jgi:hypothetical protein
LKKFGRGANKKMTGSVVVGGRAARALLALALLTGAAVGCKKSGNSANPDGGDGVSIDVRLDTDTRPDRDGAAVHDRRRARGARRRLQL